MCLMIKLDSDYALVMQSTMVADGDYQLDLLVCPDPWAVSASQEPDRMSLHLRYWLLLTHQQDVLPNQKVERAMGMSKSSSNTLYPASKSIIDYIKSFAMRGSLHVRTHMSLFTNILSKE